MLDFPYIKVKGISPIPVVNLYLQNYENSLLTATFDCAILDTGSDLTLVPYTIASKIQAKIIDSIKPVPFKGLSQQTEGIPFRIKVSFDLEHYIGVKAIAVPDDILGHEIIIGRNILNRYIITFNGPKLVFSISNVII
jgi:hypothetical protein